MSQIDIFNKLVPNQWYNSKQVGKMFPNISPTSVSKNLRQLSRYGFLNIRKGKQGRYNQSEFNKKLKL